MGALLLLRQHVTDDNARSLEGIRPVLVRVGNVKSLKTQMIIAASIPVVREAAKQLGMPGWRELRDHLQVSRFSDDTFTITLTGGSPRQDEAEARAVARSYAAYGRREPTSY